jgi:hypothetical protein
MRFYTDLSLLAILRPVWLWAPSVGRYRTNRAMGGTYGGKFKPLLATQMMSMRSPSIHLAEFWPVQAKTKR